MRCIRDAHALERLLSDRNDDALCDLIRGRIAELAEFEDAPLSDHVHFFILTPKDTKHDLETVAEWSADVQPPECLEVHPDWLELTVILGDDGFGIVIYIPRNTEDEALRELGLPYFTPANAEISR